MCFHRALTGNSDFGGRLDVERTTDTERDKKNAELQCVVSRCCAQSPVSKHVARDNILSRARRRSKRMQIQI